MRSWAILCGLLWFAGCSGIHVAERQLRAAGRARIDADGMITIRGGHLRDLDGHRVKIAAFALDATEVTVAAYRRCLAAGACTIDPTRSTRGCNLERVYVDQHPVNCVSIAEAEAFCRWRGNRLPTAHEWQWAAQGRGHVRRYVWGHYPRRRYYRGLNTFEPYVCAASMVAPDSSIQTCSVGRYDRSRDGLADLGGNVSEWVHEFLPYGSVAVGESFDYPFVQTKDLLSRVHSQPKDAVRETLARDRREPRAEPGPRIGFRCARTDPEPAP